VNSNGRQKLVLIIIIRSNHL